MAIDIQSIKVGKLKPAEYNPRKDLIVTDIEYKKIKRSIEEFGYIDPIIINSDMTIIGGHQRLKVLIDLGYKEVDCVVTEVDKTKEKALNIALNKISGEWDLEALKDLLQELNTDDIDMELTGFNMSEIEGLLKQPEPMNLEEYKEEDNSINKEIHFCPKCGFEFEV